MYYIDTTAQNRLHISMMWELALTLKDKVWVKFMTDDELKSFMKKLTLKFEKGNTQSQTFYDNLPEQFLNKMMPAIIGFELKADKLDNVFKLSQNRDEKSYDNIISKLKENGGYSAMIAAEMTNRRGALFPEGVEWDGSRFDS